MKAAFPLRRGGRPSRCWTALGVEAPTLAPCRVHARAAASRRSSSPSPDLLAVDGAQAARALHGRRLHGGALRARTERGAEANDRGRVGGSRSRDRGACASSASAARAERLRRARAEGARRASARSGTRCIDVGTNSVKFHIGERAGGRRVDDGRRPRRGHPARRGPRRHRGARRRSRSSGRSRRSRRWSTRPCAAASRRSRRSEPPGCGWRRTAPRSSTPCASARAIEVEVISGEEEARLAYVAATSGFGRRAAARSSYSTPAAAARSSRSDAASRSTSASASNVGAARFTERYGLDGVVSDGRRSPRRWTRSPPSSARLDGRPAPDTLVGMGGAITNLAAVQHGLADYDPDGRAGHRARPRRDRPPDRALPHPHGRRAARDRRACSPNAREVILAGALHRAHRAREARRATR